MDSILDYFISLQESEPAELPERAIERWNKRADFWEDARKKKEKGDERVISAINYLDSKGLLEKNYDVADIGCGPGRFAAAFAKYVHKVVGQSGKSVREIASQVNCGKSTVSRIIQRSKEAKDMAVPSVPPSQPTTSGTMGQDGTVGTIREVKQAELFAGQENGEDKP